MLRKVGQLAKQAIGVPAARRARERLLGSLAIHAPAGRRPAYDDPDLIRLANMRRKEQEKRRQRIIGELTGKIGKLRSTIRKTTESVGQSARSGLLREVTAGLLGKLRKAMDSLSGVSPQARTHRTLGKTPAMAAPRGRAMFGGVTDRTPTAGNPMVRVSSSNVASVGWEDDLDNPALGTLFIAFLNGWLYQYVNAPKWLYTGMLAAGSKGRYVWAYIRRGLYPDGVPYGSADIEGYERIDAAGRPHGHVGKRKQIPALRGRRRNNSRA